MSARGTILAAVKAAVIASGASGARVYRGRGYEVLGANFSTTYIYPIREEVDVQTLAKPLRFWDRRLSAAIDFWAKSSTPELLDEALDTAGDLIEPAVIGVLTGPTLRDLLLTSGEWSYQDKENEFIGTLRIGFTITYSLYT